MSLWKELNSEVPLSGVFSRVLGGLLLVLFGWAVLVAPLQKKEKEAHARAVTAVETGARVREILQADETLKIVRMDFKKRGAVCGEVEIRKKGNQYGTRRWFLIPPASTSALFYHPEYKHVVSLWNSYCVKKGFTF